MDSRSLRRRLAVPVAALLLAPAADAAPPPPADPIRAGLGHLHQGLYERAEATFRAAAGAAPADPEPPLFVGFAYWWRLLDDRSDTDLDAPFHAAIGASVALAAGRLEAAPEDARARAALGTAHILRFHVEAIRRNYRRAAQEARRGKRLLEEAIEADPGHADPLFALGAYNYYASQIPALARGLAAFLGLPGGDREAGLGQLRRVASSDSRFRTSGRLLLASICGSAEERCYAQAGRHLERALAETAGSPLVLGSRGDLELRLGEYDDAARSFGQALGAAAGPGPGRARQRRQLAVLRAEALLAGWRLEEAEAALAGVREERGTLTPRERRDLGRLEDELAAKMRAGETRDALRRERDGRRDEALAVLGRALEARPADPLPRWLLGRLLLKQGRAGEAARELRAAAEGGEEAPPWLQGWLQIDSGLAERALGRDRSARAHFKRAAEVRRFRSADRALMEMARDEAPKTGCDP